MENCKHGIQKDWCGICTAPIPKVSYVGGAQRPSAPARSFGYVVVHAAGGRMNESIQQLSAETTFVHVHGTPMLWLIQSILDRAPNLKTLRVIPTQLRKLRKRHRGLLEQRKVEITTGHHQPLSAWDSDRGPVSPQYSEQRKFLLELCDEPAELFVELRTYGFDPANMTARYFCLAGEPYVPQRVIAEEFGLDATNEAHISQCINAVLHYLGFSSPLFDPGKGSRQRTEAIRARVMRLRPIAQSAALRRERARQLGFPELASNLPLARLELYEIVLAAHRAGRLELLKEKSEKAWRAITLRFGLDQQGVSVYRTLQEVADLMELTRERIRQLEADALSELGISEE